jgi:hypothetical protein
MATIALSMASIFMGNWLQGGSSAFMYPDNITQGFTTRQYGLIYVEGLRKLTWAELATSTCDRWGMYIHTKSLYPVAPVCNASPVDKAKCTTLFEDHLRQRCDSYSAVTLVSWITAGLTSMSVVLVAITAIAMLLVSLGTWKRFVLAALGASAIISFPILLAYLGVAYVYFHKLSTTATYPMPTLGLGYYMALGGSIALMLATFLFWRLSKALKFTPPVNGKPAVGNTGLLDMAEQKLLDGQKIQDDTEDELDPEPAPSGP